MALSVSLKVMANNRTNLYQSVSVFFILECAVRKAVQELVLREAGERCCSVWGKGKL